MNFYHQKFQTKLLNLVYLAVYRPSPMSYQMGHPHQVDLHPENTHSFKFPPIEFAPGEFPSSEWPYQIPYDYICRYQLQIEVLLLPLHSDCVQVLILFVAGICDSENLQQQSGLGIKSIILQK